MAALFVRIQADDFDAAALQEELLPSAGVGAVATFTGLVRREAGEDGFHGLFLEHYPGMAEAAIGAILDEATQRWSISGAGVVHRVGTLAPRERIVWVGVAAPHRGDAFQACEFAMDYLKTRAPLWKKELHSAGASWVTARAGDRERATRW